MSKQESKWISRYLLRYERYNMTQNIVYTFTHCDWKWIQMIGALLPQGWGSRSMEEKIPLKNASEFA